MIKDFRGQNCRGRSFKGQDLTAADFSDSDVRGADFSGADLTDAKFCRVRMGRTLSVSLALSALKFSLGVAVGSVGIIGNMLIIIMLSTMLTNSNIGFNANVLISIMVVYTLLFAALILVAINRKRLDYLLRFFALALFITGVATVIVLGDANSETAVVWNLIGTITLVGAVIESISVAGAGLVAGAGTLAIIGVMVGSAIVAVPVYLTIGKSEMATVAVAGTMSEVIACAIFIVLGIYLGRRAIKKEENQMLLLRYVSLKLFCGGGTEFAFSTLNGVDFSQADLKYARFKNAKITHCRFQQAKNHHLALTDRTSLEPRKVRDLVIDGIVTNKNFAMLDLRGLDFSGLNLQDFDFSHADLSGANLSHTQLTGAILEGWNIDTETRLDDIDCRYYYYLENGAKKRMPPESEEYSAGEFTRIFQKIANTIDFIAHNEMELAAIKLSVEQVKVESGNDDIRVQAIEEKDGFIVVKVTVPKTEDRGILYHEVNSLKQDYETKIQILMTENHAKLGGLQGNIEILKEQIREQRQALLAAIQPQNFIQIEHHQGEIIMGDKTISTNITGSTVHGSVVTAETVENRF